MDAGFHLSTDQNEVFLDNVTVITGVGEHHAYNLPVHELSIVTSILDSVEVEAKKRPSAKFVKVGLRIGEIAGLDNDCLTFGWDAMTRDTRFDGLLLEIESVPWRNQCPSCAKEFLVRDYQTQCPTCGEAVTRCVGGEELDIAFIEVEDEVQPA